MTREEQPSANALNSWSPGGTFMNHKMAITSPFPVFQGLIRVCVCVCVCREGWDDFFFFFRLLPSSCTDAIESFWQSFQWISFTTRYFFINCTSDILFKICGE